MHNWSEEKLLFPTYVPWNPMYPVIFIDIEYEHDFFTLNLQCLTGNDIIRTPYPPHYRKNKVVQILVS